MGKRVARGELEAQIMDVLWDADAPMTPGAVQVAVTSPRRKLAYNTVTTVIVRLWEKGMLERGPEGRGFSYAPVVTRDEWAAQRMREVLDASGDRRSALLHFVEAMSAHDARALRGVLDKRRP